MEKEGSDVFKYENEDQVPLERQPSLREQLAPLTLEQMEERLEKTFGRIPRRPTPEEQAVMGFKKTRKEELLEELCVAYASCPSFRRKYRRLEGAPLEESLTAELLSQLKLVDWSNNTRPGVEASGYVTLKKAASFDYSNLALSKNFVSSPHTDRNDLSVQYLLSLGNFSNGGELCIEESPFQVSVIKTDRRLAKCDGRFPHWVSKYEGERYSVVFFRSQGAFEPPLRAVHLPLENEWDKGEERDPPH